MHKVRICCTIAPCDRHDHVNYATYSYSAVLATLDLLHRQLVDVQHVGGDAIHPRTAA